MGDDHVRGMAEATAMADAGMALFQNDEVDTVIDTEGAAKYLTEHEVLIKAKQDLEATLTGKDNKKERTAVAKEIKALKDDPKYIDAQKIAKGLQPPKGNFMVAKKKAVEVKSTTSAPAAPPAEAAPKKEDKAKKEKATKPAEATGISKEERQELEDLKKNIISKKAELKAAGKSGGECNKDPEVVQMVARMQELKIKEDPSLAEKSATKEKSSKKEKSAELATLEQEIEDYKQKLITEFKYSKKEIAADPDMVEMTKKLQKMK